MTLTIHLCSVANQNGFFHPTHFSIHLFSSHKVLSPSFSLFLANGLSQTTKAHRSGCGGVLSGRHGGDRRSYKRDIWRAFRQSGAWYDAASCPSEWRRPHTGYIGMAAHLPRPRLPVFPPAQKNSSTYLQTDIFKIYLVFFCQGSAKKHLPVWLRLCTIRTLGPMQIIPHISHLSFPLGSRMGPGDAGSELAISPQPLPACPRVPPTISTPPSSANSPFSSFHPSFFSPTLLSASGAPPASSSL